MSARTHRRSARKDVRGELGNLGEYLGQMLQKGPVASVFFIFSLAFDGFFDFPFDFTRERKLIFLLTCLVVDSYLIYRRAFRRGALARPNLITDSLNWSCTVLTPDYDRQIELENLCRSGDASKDERLDLHKQQTLAACMPFCPTRLMLSMVMINDGETAGQLESIKLQGGSVCTDDIRCPWGIEWKLATFPGETGILAPGEIKLACVEGTLTLNPEDAVSVNLLWHHLDDLLRARVILTLEMRVAAEHSERVQIDTLTHHLDLPIDMVIATYFDFWSRDQALEHS